MLISENLNVLSIVTFRPTSKKEYSGKITVISDKTDGTNTRVISGTGVDKTRIIELSEDVEFGDIVVGQTATETFTISNTGNSDLTINILITNRNPKNWV